MHQTAQKTTSIKLQTENNSFFLKLDKLHTHTKGTLLTPTYHRHLFHTWATLTKIP